MAEWGAETPLRVTHLVLSPVLFSIVVEGYSAIGKKRKEKVYRLEKNKSIHRGHDNPYRKSP